MDTMPVSTMPEVIPATGGIKLTCSTKGASIGYYIIHEGISQEPQLHTVQTWDAGFASGRTKNGEKQAPQRIWQVYNRETIPLQVGDTLQVNAMRIGYKPAVLNYTR
jgi:hypothetical protein